MTLEGKGKRISKRKTFVEEVDLKGVNSVHRC